jgi:hypothetical protein
MLQTDKRGKAVHMQSSDVFDAAAPESLPAIAVSIDDGIATVILEPHTAELGKQAKAALLAAERVRIFIDARTNANLPRPGSGPVKATDYPPHTLAFLVSHADLICAMTVDSPEGASPDKIEKMFAAFDGDEVESCRWAIRLFTDAPQSWGEHIGMYRPRDSVCLTSPIYKNDVA